MAASAVRRVVLFYPRTGADIAHATVFLPLSVVLPAAALEEAGFATEVIDQRVEPRWRERVRDVARTGPLFFGISAMTGPQIRGGLKAAELVREISPDTPIVWGGGHPTVLPEETLTDPRADAVVVGEGCGPVADLARALASGAPADALGRWPREVASTPATLDLPAVHHPRLRWREYLTPVVGRVAGLTHVTSRGCPRRCRFCHNRAANGSRWRGMPAVAVVDDLARLQALGCRAVLLFDDNFFADPGRAVAIAEGLLAAGVRLAIKVDGRADDLLRFARAELALFRRAGIRAVFVGAESGADRVLEYIGKGITVAQLREVNLRLRAHDIQPHYSFVAGFPGEAEAEVLATLRLMQDLLADNPEARLSPLKGYVPYPGTELFERARCAGFRPPETLEGWSRLDWQEGPRPWLSPRVARLVDKLSLLTVGLDTKLFEDSVYGRHRLRALAFRTYAHTCRWRCRHSADPPVPELAALRLARRALGFA